MRRIRIICEENYVMLFDPIDILCDVAVCTWPYKVKAESS